MNEFNREELIEEPQERKLNMGKSILVFNIKNSAKTAELNTGDKFVYQNEAYEIMNRETVDSPKNYVKFNCFLKTASASTVSK